MYLSHQLLTCFLCECAHSECFKLTVHNNLNRTLKKFLVFARRAFFRVVFSVSMYS